MLLPTIKEISKVASGLKNDNLILKVLLWLLAAIQEIALVKKAQVDIELDIKRLQDKLNYIERKTMKDDE